MAWRTEPDPQVGRRILVFLYDRIASLDDPRSIGDALEGPRLGVFWNYRVGDDRLIASIEDAALRILVVRIDDHRQV